MQDSARQATSSHVYVRVCVPAEKEEEEEEEEKKNEKKEEALHR